MSFFCSGSLRFNCNIFLILCRTTRRLLLLFLSLLGYLILCRYQQESHYRQPLVTHLYGAKSVLDYNTN